MPACTAFQVRRHHSKLSEKETDAVIGIIADLIVTYIEKRDESAGPASASGPATTLEGRR